MYWNNPIHSVVYPSNSNIIFNSMHGGAHCLFYDPAVNKNNIHNPTTLDKICNWINSGLVNQGWPAFVNDTKNHNGIAKLVKLNLWVKDLPIQGSVKPMLLTYTGGQYNSDYYSGTGSGRLCAMERIPNMQTVSAFITTSSKYRSQFDHLTEVTNFNCFAELCRADVGQNFLFRLTDPTAPFGIDWYEYDSRHTSSITPGEQECLVAMNNYMHQYPNTVFSPDWFDSTVEWNYL